MENLGLWEVFADPACPTCGSESFVHVPVNVPVGGEFLVSSNAHVNFTALAAAAKENGLKVQPLLTQSQFLMGIGEKNQFADAFEECGLPQERAKVALQLKHLVTPAGMGEKFRVLIAAKAVDQQRVAGLSGLSFVSSELNA